LQVGHSFNIPSNHYKICCRALKTPDFIEKSADSKPVLKKRVYILFFAKVVEFNNPVKSNHILVYLFNCYFVSQEALISGCNIVKFPRSEESQRLNAKSNNGNANPDQNNEHVANDKWCARESCCGCQRRAAAAPRSSYK
jgi:hypothetical protein